MIGCECPPGTWSTYDGTWHVCVSRCTNENEKDRYDYEYTNCSDGSYVECNYVYSDCVIC